MEKRTVTDIDEVRNVAYLLLRQPIADTKYSPLIVSHPFTNTGVTGMRDEKTGEFIMANIAENPEERKAWRKLLKRSIDAKDNPYGIFMMLHHAYAMTFLKYAGEYMSDKDFAKILGDAWVQAENANDDVEVTQEEQLEMFRRAPKKYLMSNSERKAFYALPDEVTVYRGLEDVFEHELHALSWTTDIHTAEFFANRFHKKGDAPGCIYQAKISKAHILAYFDRRDESEVIVEPAYLTDIHQTS